MQVVTIVTTWLMAQMPVIVADLWCIQLAIIGIVMSVFALLFASHVGKVEAYQHVSKKQDINSEYLSVYLANGIKTYKKLNNKIVAILVAASLLFVYTAIIKYLTCKCVVLWMLIIDFVLTVALLVWIICVISSVCKQYKRETK